VRSSSRPARAHTEYTPIGHTANPRGADADIGAHRFPSRQPNRSGSSVRATSFSNGLGPTKVKGVSEPVNVYEVTALDR